VRKNLSGKESLKKNEHLDTDKSDSWGEEEVQLTDVCEPNEEGKTTREGKVLEKILPEKTPDRSSSKKPPMTDLEKLSQKLPLQKPRVRSKSKKEERSEKLRNMVSTPERTPKNSEKQQPKIEKLLSSKKKPPLTRTDKYINLDKPFLELKNLEPDPRPAGPHTDRPLLNKKNFEIGPNDSLLSRIHLDKIAQQRKKTDPLLHTVDKPPHVKNIFEIGANDGATHDGDFAKNNFGKGCLENVEENEAHKPVRNKVKKIRSVQPAKKSRYRKSSWSEEERMGLIEGKKKKKERKWKVLP